MSELYSLCEQLDKNTEKLLYNGVDLEMRSDSDGVEFQELDRRFREAIPRFGVVPRGGLDRHLENMHRRYRVLLAASKASSTLDHNQVIVLCFSFFISSVIHSFFSSVFFFFLSFCFV